MQNIQLLQGDCLEVMKNIEDKSVDLVLCDLPYGVMDAEWDKIIDFEKLWAEYKRIVKDNGIFILFANGLFTVKVINSNVEMYKYKYVWLKRTPSLFVHAKNRPLVRHEDILVFSNAKIGHRDISGNQRMTYNPQGLKPLNKKISKIRNNTEKGYIKFKKNEQNYTQEFTNYPSDVLTEYFEAGANEKFHPNQKPTNLLEFLIKTYTNENDLVLDNCMGSGSTGIAAKNTGRKFIGIEKDEEYYKIAKNRIESFVRIEGKKDEVNANQLSLF